MNKKYPRTWHLFFSKGATDDDKIAKDISGILNVPIVISEKLDGGCSDLNSNGLFARTHVGPPTHKSFDWLKAFHTNTKHLIPSHLQIFGENMYALHSIAYDKLPSYFLVFNIRDTEKNLWLSWDEVEEWAKKIGAPTVPVLFRGTIKNEKELQEIVEKLCSDPSEYGTTREGVVIRLSGKFSDKDFSRYVLKAVRAGHVQTDSHWSRKKIVKNKLK